MRKRRFETRELPKAYGSMTCVGMQSLIYANVKTTPGAKLAPQMAGKQLSRMKTL